jgi:hypothetical protein
MKKLEIIIVIIILLFLATILGGCYENRIKPDYVTIQGVHLDLNKELTGFKDAEREYLRNIYINLGKRR